MGRWRSNVTLGGKGLMLHKGCTVRKGRNEGLNSPSMQSRENKRLKRLQRKKQRQTQKVTEQTPSWGCTVRIMAATPALSPLGAQASR